MALSELEQKVYDFVKENNGTITIKEIKEKLGEKYLGAIGRLVRNEIVEITKIKANEDVFAKWEKAVKLVEDKND